jgi:hypothetical protein
MAADKKPNQAPPTTAPVRTKTFIPGIGETETQEWPIGTRGDLQAKYDALVFNSKIGGLATGNMTALSYKNAEGRASLVATFEKATSENSIDGTNTRIVEELYAIDVVRDVRSAPYWTTAGTALTDDQIADVTDAVDRTLAEADITNWGTWSASQKQLRYHLLHGQDSYFETAFILRQSKHGVITSQVKASFTNINTVVTAPTLSTQMNLLIEALPSGEWIYKPPQAEHLGGGKWRISLEWHWAEKWSKIYGGTWGL